MPVSREALTNAKLRTEEVFVEDLNDTVVVSEMSAGGRARYREHLLNMNGKGEVEVNGDHYWEADLIIVHESLCNPDGSRMFGESEFDLVCRLSTSLTDKVLPVAKRLSGLDKKAQDDAAKNSDEIPSDSTPTL